MIYYGYGEVENLLFSIQDEKKRAIAESSKNINNENESRIISEDRLKQLFFDIIVKYRISELLRVDPFVGFDFDLVIAADCFDISVQNIMDRAIGLSCLPKYKEIMEFINAYDRFVFYLGKICQVSFDGKIARFDNHFDNMHDHTMPVEDLRRKALEAFQII